MTKVMDQKLSEQLVKILAMADSAHDGEAIVALRKARELLARAGLSFADLARGSSKGLLGRSFGALSGQQQTQAELAELRLKLDHAQAEAHMYNAKADVWRRRATELEQILNQRKAEAERWKQLAQETVEKLWDIGVDIGVEDEALRRAKVQ